jgi:hypothetical protein
MATFGVNDSPNWVLITPAALHTYRFSAWVRSATATGSARLQVREFAGSLKIGPTALSTAVKMSPVWQLVSLDFTCQQAGSTLDLQVLDYPALPGESFLIDNLAIRDQATTDVDPLAGTARLSARIAPNPFRGGAQLAFALPGSGSVRIVVVDLSGRLLRVVLNEKELSAGQHMQRLDGRDGNGGALPSGLYFCRIETPFGTIARRFAVLQ